MLAKLTAKNQLTLPNHALDLLGIGVGGTYFEAGIEDGKLTLTPVGNGSAGGVRRKLAELGLTDVDVADALSLGRRAS